jgi:transposase
MKDTPKPDKRRKYDAAYRAEALRLAEQSRSAQAAARALNIDTKRIYQWQKAAQTPVAAFGATLDPNTAAERDHYPCGGYARCWAYGPGAFTPERPPSSGR